jgi:hypothetical protein
MRSLLLLPLLIIPVLLAGVRTPPDAPQIDVSKLYTS